MEITTRPPISTRSLCEIGVKGRLLFLLRCGVWTVHSASVVMAMMFKKVRTNTLCVGLPVKVRIEASMLEWIRKALSRDSEKVKTVRSSA